MKITVWTWKDERWSADRETLKHINKMIKKEKPVVNSIGEKVFLVVGWIAVSPFVLSELIILGFKRLIKLIRK